MNIIYSHEIPLEDYMKLRESAGWMRIRPEQAQAGLNGSRFLISAKYNERTVGCARVVSDGGYIAYLADVLVLPEYQGHGIGSEIVKRLMEMVKDSMQDGDKVCFVLLAAKGKEGFYERFGFIKRPKEYLGHGMSQWVEK